MKKSNFIWGVGFAFLFITLFSCDLSLQQENPQIDPNTGEYIDPGSDTLDASNLPESHQVIATLSNPANHDIKSKIDHVGDEDFYRVYAEKSGVMEVIARVVPNNLRLRVQIFDSDGTAISGGNKASSELGQAFQLEITCSPGWYYLKVSSVTNESDSNQYVVQVYFDFEDIYEPNNTNFQATEIAFDEVIQAKIRAAGDEDHFYTEITETGVLNVRVAPVPSENRLRAKIYEELNPTLLAQDQSDFNSQGFEFDLYCYPGKYFIIISDLYNLSSTDFYDLLITYDTSDSYEPNNSLFEAKEISLRDTIRGKMRDQDDIDFFQIGNPGPDTLLFSFFAVPHEQRVQVTFYDQHQQYITLSTSGTAQAMQVELPLYGDRVYFKIEDSRNISGKEFYEFVVDTL